MRRSVGAAPQTRRHLLANRRAGAALKARLWAKREVEKDAAD